MLMLIQFICTVEILLLAGYSVTGTFSFLLNTLNIHLWQICDMRDKLKLLLDVDSRNHPNPKLCSSLDIEIILMILRQLLHSV